MLSRQTSRPALVFAVKDSSVDVRPELFDQIRESVNSHLNNPALSDLCPSPFLAGVVEAGDAGCSTIASNFRKVRGRVALVVAGDEQARDRVDGSFHHSAVAQRIVARIFA